MCVYTCPAGVRISSLVLQYVSGVGAGVYPYFSSRESTWISGVCVCVCVCVSEGMSVQPCEYGSTLWCTLRVCSRLNRSLLHMNVHPVKTHTNSHGESVKGLKPWPVFTALFQIPSAPVNLPGAPAPVWTWAGIP